MTARKKGKDPTRKPGKLNTCPAMINFIIRSKKRNDVRQLRAS
jgi:hypothetical protein